jgi:hypothetical protein
MNKNNYGISPSDVTINVLGWSSLALNQAIVVSVLEKNKKTKNTPLFMI